MPSLDAQSPVILVKVGSDGTDSVFRHSDILTLDRMALLVSLKNSEMFATSLKDVSLDRCAVLVVRSADKVPSKEEEMSAVELISSDTIGDVCVGGTSGHSAHGGKVFLRVQLPVGPLERNSNIAAEMREALPAQSPFTPLTTRGTLAYDEATAIPASVWSSMGLKAQETARRASEQRRKLAAVAALRELGATPGTTCAVDDYAKASQQGVTILRTESSRVALAAIDLPSLDSSFILPPKGIFLLELFVASERPPGTPIAGKALLLTLPLS